VPTWAERLGPSMLDALEPAAAAGRVRVLRPRRQHP
jgi:hypothetical protein